MLSVLATAILFGGVNAADTCNCSCFGGFGRSGKASADGNYCLTTWGNAYHLCPAESGDSWKDIVMQRCGQMSVGAGCCNMHCCDGDAVRKTYSEETAEPTSQPTGEPTSQPTGEPTSQPTVEPTSEPTAEPVQDTPLMTPWDLSAELTCNNPRKCACSSTENTGSTCASYDGTFTHPNICSANLSAEDCLKTCQDLPDCNFVTRGDYPNGGSFCHLYNVCEQTRKTTFNTQGFRKTDMTSTNLSSDFSIVMSTAQLESLCDATDGRRRLLGSVHAVHGPVEIPGQTFHKWHVIAGVLAASNMYLFFTKTTIKISFRCCRRMQDAHVL